MAETTDLLARADSLIRAEFGPPRDEPRGPSLPLRRRRAYLAASAATAGEPGAPAAAADHEDLPVLTEVVPPASLAGSHGPQAAEPAWRAKLATEFAESLERQVQDRMSELLEAALMVAAEDLRRGIGEAVHSAIAEFLDQRGQLNLALEMACTTHAATETPVPPAETPSDPV